MEDTMLANEYVELQGRFETVPAFATLLDDVDDAQQVYHNVSNINESANKMCGCCVIIFFCIGVISMYKYCKQRDCFYAVLQKKIKMIFRHCFRLADVS